MARVLGIHQLDLLPGADEQAFEKFMTERFAPLYHHYDPRQVAYLMKGDRGERAGKYSLVIEVESVEARDDMYPAEGQVSATLQEALVANAALFTEFKSYLALPDPPHTDYVVMG